MPGRFSFNVKGGRCEACQGDGVIKVEMHFLPDIYVPCDVCRGQRYNRETLEVRYKGRNIHEVLEMTVEDATEFFRNVPVVARKLQTLMDVGLSYIRLGQNATTLSGGEAQRVKLASRGIRLSDRILKKAWPAVGRLPLDRRGGRQKNVGIGSKVASRWSACGVGQSDGRSCGVGRQDCGGTGCCVREREDDDCAPPCGSRL
jgi:alpha-D-ribose 1-methylphosphonate 5-triphosphate synthase subunit PhnL